MITVLTGSNSFALHHDLGKFVAQFERDYSDLAIERVDGEEATYERITEAIQGLPFLSSKKLVLLRAPGADKKFAEGIEQVLSDVPATNDIVIVEPKLDKRSSYYKYLKKHTELKEYAQPDENGMAAWLQREAKARLGSISSNDARYLIERVGADQQNLSNELDKLLTYQASVSRATIDLLTEATPQSTIFQLLEAAFAGQAKRALSLYAEQRVLKVEPQQIIAMLAWQLHILAVIKSAGTKSADEIAKDAKMSPYVIRKSQTVARQLSLTILKQQIADLLSIDLRSKRTALDLDEALQHYILVLAT